MKTLFEEGVLEQYDSYIANGEKISFKKLKEIIKECLRTPYIGIGKPEQLKENLTGYWSRRIDDKNRLVYRVDEENDILIIASCRGHYGDK